MDVEKLETKGQIVFAERAVARLVALGVVQHLLSASSLEARSDIKAIQVEHVESIPIQIFFVAQCLVFRELVLFILYIIIVHTIVPDAALRWRQQRAQQRGRRQREQLGVAAGAHQKTQTPSCWPSTAAV